MTFDLGLIKRQQIKQNLIFGGAVAEVTNNFGNFRTHTFSTSSQFTVFSPTLADILLVAGGGGGRQYRGGGGAGGVIQKSVLLQPGTYTVITGSGGIGGSLTSVVTSGNNSSITGPSFQLVALGGGGGFGNPSQSGGSGAGSTAPNLSGSGPRGGTPGIGLQPSSSWGGLGNNGGTYGGNYAIGGGGGAGGPGLRGWSNIDETAGIGGYGGPGIASDISGTVQYYAGGGAGQARFYGIGYNGPINGYGPSTPIRDSQSQNIVDKAFINATAIRNMYGTHPFSATFTVPTSGIYLIRWYTTSMSSFTWNIDGGTEFDNSYGTSIKLVRNLTLTLSAGQHTVSFSPVSTYNSRNARWARAEGQFAWAISTTDATAVYWNTRNYAILSGGPDYFGGGGGPNQNGGSGIAIIRYRK